jgi:uncharacterized protein (DUF433 family)
MNPEQCSGKPCIRGIRIRVIDILELFINGFSHQGILNELPDLEPDDITACLLYAAHKLDSSTRHFRRVHYLRIYRKK